MGYNIQRQIRVATLATQWHRRAYLRPYDDRLEQAATDHGKDSPEYHQAKSARERAGTEAALLGPYAHFTGAALAALLAIADHADEATGDTGADGKPIDKYRPGGTRETFLAIDTIVGEAGDYSRSSIAGGLKALRAGERDGKAVLPALKSVKSSQRDCLTFTIVDLTTPYVNQLVRDGIAQWATTAGGNRKLVEAVPYVRASSRGHASRPESGEEELYMGEPEERAEEPAVPASTRGGMFDEGPQTVPWTPGPTGEAGDWDVVDAEVIEDEPVATVTTLAPPAPPQHAPMFHAPARVVAMAARPGLTVRAQAAVKSGHEEVLAWAGASEHNRAAVDSAIARAAAAGIDCPTLVRVAGEVAAVDAHDAARVHEALLDGQQGLALRRLAMAHLRQPLAPTGTGR